MEMSDVFTNQEVLVAHANARLNLHGRRLLVARVIDDGRPVAHVAKELGVSRQCAHRWVARFRAEGEAGLLDRSSRPHRCPRRTPRRGRAAGACSCAATSGVARTGSAPSSGIPARTVSAILRRHQVPYLRECDPLTGEVIRASKTTAVRYEHDHPGLAGPHGRQEGRPHPRRRRLEGPRPRRRERPARRSAPGSGSTTSTPLVDDHSRLAYSEILPDEKGTDLRRVPAAGRRLLRRPRHHPHRAGHDRQPLQLQPLHATSPTPWPRLGAKHVFIRPHCPWQNGKVERYNRTLQVEWAYRQVFLSNAERTAALAPWLEFYNTGRRHSAIGGLPPISRLS